ncbi:MULTISPECIES: class I SAM-dependent methyltransferase [unclassified Agrococcus]|uniref:class I SAM-dependent methyltransferase n=1 Tax=unclassified Agrococcus TaxID=2615065 RepID=UPI0036226507
MAAEGAAYDAVALAYDRLLPSLDAEHPRDLAMLSAFADAAADAGGDVVDVGCGTGRVARWLGARDLRVHGVDPSEGMLCIARAAQPGARWSRGTATEVPVADACAGGVLAWYSLIHVPDAALDAAAAELARVVRPGGVVLVAAQSGSGMRTIASAYGTDATLTAWAHDAAALASALEGAGLDVVARLERGPEGRERMPQASVLARRAAS